MLPDRTSAAHDSTSASNGWLPKYLSSASGTIETERARGERFIQSTGQVQWLSTFTPVGPAKLRAFVPGSALPMELPPDVVADLAERLAAAPRLYAPD